MVGVALAAPIVLDLENVLFALGLGLAIGAVWRRTAPAVIASFLAYVGFRLFVDGWLRQRFVAPLTATWSVQSRGPNLDKDSVVWSGLSDRAGHPFDGNFAALQACWADRVQGRQGAQCQLPRAARRRLSHAVWQPASRFWEFHGIETALFAGARRPPDRLRRLASARLGLEA
jgi:hypothetical protein